MFVSVVVVRSMLEEVQRRGISRAELLRNSSLTEDQLADMRTMVGADLLDDIVVRAIELLDNPGLGLTLGTKAPEGLAQIISHLALSVPTLRESYALLERYSPILVDDIHQALTHHAGRSMFSYDFHDGMGLATTRFAAEYLGCFCLRLARRFAPDIVPLEMRFRYPEPPYVSRYEAVFGCPLRFSQDEYAIVCDSSLFDRQQFHADSTVSDLLRAAAEQLLTQVGATMSVTDRLRALLRQEPDLCHVDLDRLARRLGTHRRGLRRKLLAEGANVTHLLEQARVDRARVELLRRGASIKETAERLGYSEPSAFHRAFKRWTGMPPALFMKNNALPEAGVHTVQSEGVEREREA
jgi:AraC-like DNA-binding protein